MTIEKSDWKNKEGTIVAPFDTITQKYSFGQREWFEDTAKHVEEIDKFKSEIKERIRSKLEIIEAKLGI